MLAREFKLVEQPKINPGISNAFFSYTRWDDNYLEGGITWLREDLEKAARVYSGVPFEIFQDVDDIHPGDQWQKKLNQALQGAQVFIPILTPRFFQSKFCRKEAENFLDYEARAGRDDLIMPIYLIDVDVLEQEALRDNDSLAAQLHERQFVDMRSLATKLRHGHTRCDVTDTISNLAKSLVSILAEDIATPAPQAPCGSVSLRGELKATRARLAEIEDEQARRQSDWQAELDTQDRRWQSEYDHVMQLHDGVAKENDELHEHIERLASRLNESDQTRSELQRVKGENAWLTSRVAASEQACKQQTRSPFLDWRVVVTVIAAFAVGLLLDARGLADENEQLRTSLQSKERQLQAVSAFGSLKRGRGIP